MRAENKGTGSSGKALKKIKELKRKDPPQFVLAILLLVYLGSSIMISMVSRQQGIMHFLGGTIPYSAFTGVFSGIGNICVIFMVVYFRKFGYITSMTILLIQFPLIIFQFITEHNVSSLPGLFSNTLTIIAISLIYTRNRKIDDYQRHEIENLTARQKLSQRLFEQTATALVNAIDAKDTYSHGHSIRVAEYSEKIARMMGKSEEECYEIKFAALLHDVGKIGIANSILNKKGKLTYEEYEIIKSHPVMGNQILMSIGEYPFLSIGAHYHHERYDGRGYPENLKGDDIPEIARIISVADAYDAMSSNRSYRDAIPQQLVREEIVKGAGTQFDPEVAKIMLKLIDLDVEYRMKERKITREFSWKNEIVCGEHRNEISDGIIIIPFIETINMKVSPEGKELGEHSGASIILFDALDGRVHNEERTKRELCYYEYCELWFDGRYEAHGVRKVQVNKTESKWDKKKDKSGMSVNYHIEAVKCRDHFLLRVDDGKQLIETIVALPDCSRYVYLAVTGENCKISDVNFSRNEKMIGEDYIPRIAERIYYIDKPEGNIPNLQVDGFMTGATSGIRLKDKLVLSFHTMSLPTARLVWHCPYIVIYYSIDGKKNGQGYREFAIVRLDGEVLGTNDDAVNTLTIDKNEKFISWDHWKEKNKEGYDSKVTIVRERNIVTITTENLGIYLRNETVVLDGTDEIFAAITGDQIALTGINVVEG